MCIWPVCPLCSIPARTDKNLVVPVEIIVEGFGAETLKAYVTEQDKMTVQCQENKEYP